VLLSWKWNKGITHRSHVLLQSQFKSYQIQNLARSSTRNDMRRAQTQTSANGGVPPLSLGFFAQGAHQMIKNWISMSKSNRGWHHQK
jgi:hypothetical protein